MISIFLPIILIISALLRFYNNTAIALWHDEAFSALYIRYPLEEMMQRIILDVHPPLYYLILRGWSYFAGHSLLSLRLLSIFFGVLTVWAGYALVRAAFKNKRLALISAAVLAVNPFQIQYALEARMYTLGTFLALASSYLLLKATDPESAVSKKKYWALYGITVAAAFYTHYYLFFTIAAQAAYIFLASIKWRTFRLLVSGILAYILAAILYLPWVPSLLAQVSRVSESFWIPAMNRWSVPGTVWKMIFGGDAARESVLLVTAILAGITVLYFLKRVKNFNKWLIVLGAIVPFALSVALSWRTNLYLDRYFVFASLFVSLLIALAFAHIPKKFMRYMLLVSLLGTSLYAFQLNWEKLNIAKKPGMAAAAEVVNENAKGQDRIYVASSFIFFTFKYYNQTQIHAQLISDRPLKDIPHFSGTAILTEKDLILDPETTPKGTTIWLLWTTGFGGNKPGVPKNWKPIREQSFEDAPGFKGSIFVSEYQVN